MREFPQFAQHQLAESRIDLCGDRQRPVVFVRELTAFYRILFGHQDVLRVGKGEIACGIGMMIGENVSGEIDAKASQELKETFRPADLVERIRRLLQDKPAVSSGMEAAS